MATSGRMSGAVLLLLVSVSFWVSSANALQVENCLPSKLHFTAECNGLIQGVSELLPGHIINLVFTEAKGQLSELKIVVETDPHKVYTATYVDLKSLSLLAKIKIGPKKCGYKNQGIAVDVYTSFLGFFSFKLSFCLTPTTVKF